MAGRKKGSGNAKPSDIQAGLDALIRLGSSEAAEKATSFKAATIRRWKSDHPELYHDLSQRHARELTEHHAANVKQAWRDAAEAAKQAAHDLRADPALSPRDKRQLAGIILDFARLGDHAMRLDAGDPTSITETRTREELLEDAATHAARLAELGIDLDAPNTDHTGGERH